MAPSTKCYVYKVTGNLNTAVFIYSLTDSRILSEL